MTPIQDKDYSKATTKEILAEIRALRRAFNRDIREAAKVIPEREVRYLVGMYYTAQQMRIAVEGKLRALDEEPNAMLGLFLEMFEETEKDIQAALDVYTANNAIGASFRRVKGVGPVLTAAWLAHVNVHIARNCSKVLAFGGYNPNMKWEKGQKRPYNADLKLVFNKMGRAFVFLSNRNSYFGQRYKENKALVEKRNDAGMFADRCAELLRTRNYRKETNAYKCYSVGKYPPAHVSASARLKTVALCVGVLHREHYRVVFGEYPVDPFLVAFPDATPNKYGDNPKSALLPHHNLIDIEDVIKWEATAPKSTKIAATEAEDANVSDNPNIARMGLDPDEVKARKEDGDTSLDDDIIE
jgi:hypothetical protein